MSAWPKSALLVLLAGAFASGCGGKDTDPSRFLSDRDASFLRVRVEQAAAAHADDECSDARSEVTRALDRVDTIEGRGRVSRRLTRNLQDWLVHLREQLGEECGRDSEPSATATPDETPEETATPDETETTTEPERTTTTEPEETVTPEPTPSRTATPDPTETPDNGGAPSGGDSGDGGGGSELP